MVQFKWCSNASGSQKLSGAPRNIQPLLAADLRPRCEAPGPALMNSWRPGLSWELLDNGLRACVFSRSNDGAAPSAGNARSGPCLPFFSRLDAAAGKFRASDDLLGRSSKINRTEPKIVRDQMPDQIITCTIQDLSRTLSYRAKTELDGFLFPKGTQQV